MARRGSYLSMVSVTQPLTTVPPVQGGSILNPAAFILLNEGREGADTVTINTIEVMDQSYANATAAGSFRLARITLSGTPPARLDALHITPHDSDFPVPAGLSAYPGLVEFSSSEAINNPLFTPSYQVVTSTFSIMGLGGDMRPAPVILQDGQGLNIDALGASHSTLNVTVTVEAAGHRYSVCGDTVGRGDVFTVVNRTGSPVTIRGVRVGDYPRATATLISYLAAVVSGKVWLDMPARTTPFDASLPDWIKVGNGSFPLSQDNWADPSQIFQSHVVARHTATTASTAGPPNMGFKKINKGIILAAGQALVLYPVYPQQSAGNAGEHDILVTYTVDELAQGVSGGEYSYAS